MLNKIMLIGRLGNDPEMRYSQNGKAITKFRIATDSGWGENKQTDWHAVVCFDKTAESCAKYLVKGRQVFVEGRVSYRKWDKDDGTTQWFTEIIARDVRFLSDGSSGSRNYSGGADTRDRGGNFADPPNTAKNQGAKPDNGFADGFADSDIPF